MNINLIRQSMLKRAALPQTSQNNVGQAAENAAKADEQAVMGVKMRGMQRIKKQIWER